MGIDARSGLIVALVPGGTAEQDGLIFVGDTITAVDGVALAGQRLGNMLPSETGASCELTLTRTDETFTQQLQCLGLPPHSTYKLLRLQVRRSVADGLGVAMQAALVREVTAATSELKIGDVVLKVDGEPLGPGRALHSVLEAGRLVYTFVVARRLEKALPSVADESDAPVELAPETRRAEQDRESRAGQPWSSSGLVEELQAEAHAARCAVAEMVRERAAEDALKLERLAQAAINEDALQLDRSARAAIEEEALQLGRMAQAAIEEDSDDERGAPRRVRDEASTSTSMPHVPPLQQPSKGSDALVNKSDGIAAARAASQVVHCLLAPPPTKNRSEVVMPTVLLAPTRYPGRVPSLVSADVYNAGTGTWCDLPTSLVSGDARGEEVVWSDIPVGATRGSTTRINTSSNEVDSASHALMAMIEQVPSAPLSIRQFAVALCSRNTTHTPPISLAGGAPW